MQNEVFPTQFTRQNSEVIGSSRSQLPTKLCLKVYSGTERKSYMDGTITEALQTDNVARIAVKPQNEKGNSII